MLVISLDEYGKFEGEIWRRCMIAGTVFSCEDTGALLEEQRRIIDYLQLVCSKSDAEFPRDLHPVYDREKGGVINGDEMERVQATIEKTLAKFLKDAEPQGRYYLYAVVSEPEGVSAFSGEDAGNLIDDTYAGNRYLHMSQMAIRNLVINNPIIQDNAYHMELATRILPISSVPHGKRKILQKQADRLGMPHVFNTNGTLKEDYSLTDANSYIALLSSAVMEDKRKDLDFHLNVQSIKYENIESRLLIQSSMLLADVVCSTLQPAVKEEDKAALRLQELANSYTTHNDNMIWCYHDVDFKLRQAINSQMNGHWFECLNMLYEIYSEDSEQAAFYKDTWVKLILQKMQDEISPMVVADAARQLMRELKKPNVSIEKCRYIAETLVQLSNDEDDDYGQCSYLINSCLMTMYNHVSDYDSAERCYRKCEKYARSAPLEEYLELRNTYSVTLLDRQKYEEALENTAKTLKIAELTDRLRGETLGEDGYISVHRGKTLSQMGQCLAFLGRHEEAAECFTSALTAFDRSPVDLQITRSYLLHCYIEGGNKAAYSKLAEEYFGEKDIIKQINGVFDKDDTTVAFALLVYLKGWYRFGFQNIYTRQAEQILGNIVEYGRNRNGHPWELIWKYVVLLGKKSKIKKKETIATAEESLRTMLDKTAGLLRQICQEAVDSCVIGKETSVLPYMYR